MLAQQRRENRRVPGTIFSAKKEGKRALKGVPRKIYDTYVKRKNLNEIRDLVLNVSAQVAQA